MKKKTIRDFRKMKAKKEPISWVTAYDFPFAKCAEEAGIDLILVGDSGSMVQLGYETTNPVSLDEMLVLTKAARRGAPKTFIVGDMPQGTYEVSDIDAVKNALRFVKEANCDAIKLEGGKRVESRVKAITDAGIIVFGHLGLTPQSTQTFGGYRVQGKTKRSFEAIIEDSLALEKAGATALLLEAVPSEISAQIRNNLTIPVFGIGAGKDLDGQLLIMHDLLGLFHSFRPKFAKCYVPEIVNNYSKNLKSKNDLQRFGVESREDGLIPLVRSSIKKYIEEVKDCSFPSDNYSYPLKKKFLEEIKQSPYWK